MLKGRHVTLKHVHLCLLSCHACVGQVIRSFEVTQHLCLVHTYVHVYTLRIMPGLIVHKAYNVC